MLITDLLPNSTYEFTIQDDSWSEAIPTKYSYKTFDLDDITIINGGDMGNSKLAILMNEKVVNNIDADLIMIGGDIAYENNIPT